ncbi:hypothetical protein ACIBEJ_21755 [Nonomuraea sp. NPDC050790]|uniref:hypothetical protein n=1 Tax=Nonomuraea sp. NPDC050790 TaxID=3364371 RepID=UPI0037914D67
MNIAYLYPWDVVGDPTAPGRIADLGVEAVALAASYHSTRAATPYHPNHRVLDVAHSAFYLPVRQDAWGPVVPASPTWTPPDAYLTARDALKAVGLKVLAWTVLTHNSYLGSKHPGLATRNAFGDLYAHALCPAHPEVIDYCERLTREILTVAEPDGLILESCGPMGFGHQNMHEKTAGADWNGPLGDLLSLCFCTACAPRYPEGTREHVKRIIDTQAPSSTTTAAALADRAQAVQEVRLSLSTHLRQRLISVARELSPETPITLHANPDPWAAGAFAALPNGEPDADVLVGNCWGDPTADADRLTTLANIANRANTADTPTSAAKPSPAAARPTPQRIGAYVLALPPRPADATVLADQMATYAKAGATELHLYHAGLASPARLSALRAAINR